MLAFSNHVRGLKLGRSHRIFKELKFLNRPSFGGVVKRSHVVDVQQVKDL